MVLGWLEVLDSPKKGVGRGLRAAGLRGVLGWALAARVRSGR